MNTGTRRAGRTCIPRAPAGVRLALGIALIAMLMGAPVAGQVPAGSDAWRWASFGRADGLPPGSVSALAESSSGIVWAATDAGLAWFDGFVWNRMGASRGVPERPVTRLVPRPRGGVLAIIHGRVYRGDTTGFVDAPVRVSAARFDSTRPDRVAEQVVTAVAPLGSTDLLALISRDAGVSSTRAVVRMRDTAITPVQAPQPLDSAADLFVTRSGTVYLSAVGQLYRWNGETWLPSLSIGGSETAVAGLAGNAAGAVIGFALQPVEDRGVFEGTEGGALRRVVSEGSAPALSADVGPSGDAVMLYQSGQIRLRSRGTWTDPDYIPPALGRSARSVLYTDRGDLWFGTDDGAVLYRATARRWTGWSFPFPDPRAVVNAVLVTRRGDVWTGTDDGVVVHRTSQPSPEPMREVHGHRLGIVTALAQDGTGAIWVGSGVSFPGAYRWDGRTWRHLGVAEGLALARVDAIAVDRRGQPWFLGTRIPGDTAGPGAFVYRNGRFESWGDEKGVPNGRVFAFVEDSSDALWFATPDGVSRWRAGTWTHWTKWHGVAPDGRGVAVPLEVRSLAVGAGRVWLADARLGVGAIDASDSLRVWGTRDGLPSGGVRDIDVDESATVWAATTRGVCYYRDDDPMWDCIGTSAGLSTDNVRSIAADRWSVYIGTQGDGLQVLSRAEAIDPPPHVSFREPIVQGRVVRVQWDAHAFNGAIPRTEVRTRYRVDGAAWSGWGTGREVSLAGQHPGRHVIQVQARALFAPLIPRTAALAVNVPLPLVLRPVFAVPIGVLLAGLAFVGLFSWRERRRAIETLRASEARFRSLGEAAFEGIGFIGEDRRFVEVNARLAQMFGYEREELVGVETDLLVAPRSHAALREMRRVIGQTTPSEPVMQVDLWGRRKRGAEFPIEIQTKTMPVEKGLVRVLAVRDITDRYAAEEARRRSEEKFAKAFWASPDAVDIAREADGRFIEVNEALVRLYGRPRDEMIGRSGAELGLWADEAERERYWARVRAEGRVRGFSCRLRAASGEVRDCVIAADRIEIGGESCVIALTRDVTEQRRTLAALQVTQFSVDRASDAVLWLDSAGQVRYANETAAASLGYSADGLVGIPASRLSVPWDDAAWPDFWALVRDQGSALRTARWRTRAGQEFPVEVLCSHLAAGGREYLVVSARDISERLAAEQALLASEAKFATAFRSSPSGLVIVRAVDGTILEANSALLRLVGMSRRGVVGRPANDLGLCPSDTPWEVYRDRVLAGQGGGGGEIRIGPGVDERVALLSAEALDLDGERCLLCVLQDVTEKDRAHQALEENREALRVLSRQLMEAQEAERARISRELHDEIGQALAAVKLNLQAIGRLSDDARVTAQVRDGVSIVDSTVVEVRNLSRDLRPSVLDDLGLIAALQWYLGRQGERARLEIGFTPPAHLPRPSREIETACYRIVQEALTNVVRHAGAASVDVEVTMDGADFVLTVRDDGRGFDLSLQSRERTPSTHLGLVGMRERAEKAGGVLSISSSPGAGTVVRARFDTTHQQPEDVAASVDLAAR
jgi:PAS domain S-box-containing protein